MFTELFIALLSAFQLWLAPAASVPAPAAPAQVAQAAPKAVNPADRAAGAVFAAEDQRRGAIAEKNALTRTHRSQLAEIDRLKKSRASWRRDRQLKQALAESQETAALLSKVDRRLRTIDRRLDRARRALASQARAELSAGATGARAARLRGWVASSERALVRSRKIVLPDDSIDPLADPEDLEYQAQRIAQSERELETEIRAMVSREERYQRMAKLRSKASRAATLESLDDDRPRRTTGRIGTGADRGQGAGSFEDDAADPSPGAPPENDAEPTAPTDGAGLGAGNDPVVVLADVVDAGTLSALRRAESSGDPRVKAAATRRARLAVQQQLERLRKARTTIQRRAKSLRKR